MSTAARTRTRSRSRASRQAARRRRIGLFVAAVVVIVAGAAALMPRVDDAVQEVTLPLRHEDIIRQQSEDKDLDAALIAAVIYAESRFAANATSEAGARGLMQITPQTAEEIARRSGGTQFEQGDLAEPQINIAYGSWYLDWLLGHYGGNDTLAIAAYNAGTGNVDKWIARDPGLTVEEIPFPETRAYVAKVLQARRDYRREYRGELGL